MTSAQALKVPAAQPEAANEPKVAASRRCRKRTKLPLLPRQAEIDASLAARLVMACRKVA